MLHMFLFFSVVSLFVDLQINPFRLSPSHSATETRSFRFSVRIVFGRSAFAGAPDKLFHWGLNPISAALAISKYSSKTSDISLMCRCVLNTANAVLYHSFITFAWKRNDDGEYYCH